MATRPSRGGYLAFVQFVARAPENKRSTSTTGISIWKTKVFCIDLVQEKGLCKGDQKPEKPGNKAFFKFCAKWRLVQYAEILHNRHKLCINIQGGNE